MSLGFTVMTSECHSDWRNEQIELPEGNIADNENSTWESHTNGNHEEAGRNAATTKYLQSKARPEELAEWEDQDQHLHPADRQVHCWDNKQAKGGDASDIKARRFLPCMEGFTPSLHPETVR